MIFLRFYDSVQGGFRKFSRWGVFSISNNKYLKFSALYRQLFIIKGEYPPPFAENILAENFWKENFKAVESVSFKQ